MRGEPIVQRSGARKARGVAAFLRRLVVLLAGTVAALVVAEYSSRLVVARTSASSAPNVSVQGPGHVPVNSLGFREREIGPKRPDQYRIIVIGDSYTWGQ